MKILKLKHIDSYIILLSASEKLGKSSSHSDCSVGHHHDLIGRTKISKKNDSDSGRGESESETHSRNHKVATSTTLLGDWCQPDCLTLGHSDQCWLPPTQIQTNTNSNHAYEVEVTGGKWLAGVQASSLSVLESSDRTSDYSSHSEKTDLFQKKNRNLVNSKPCFV